MIIKNNIKVKANEYAKYIAVEMEREELSDFVNTIGKYLSAFEELIFLCGSDDFNENGKEALKLLRAKLNKLKLGD